MGDDTSQAILIIDDDESLLRAISTRLSSLRYHCVTAGSAEEGLEQFRLGRIDLVITDLVMPQSDGFSLLLKIREVSTVPIIVITGFASKRPDFLRRFPDVKFFSKPFDSESLTELVEAELAVRQGTAVK
jgi:DNA-binding NtrC family response regulator